MHVHRHADAPATPAPGARTPWKTNPAGQTVVVTDGVGRARSEGREIVELHRGEPEIC